VKTVYVSRYRERIIGVDAVDNEVISQAQSDEEILTFDIPDDALERAANAEQAYTLAYCTHPWYHCPWPQ
jgi:hypothetical protein